MSDKDMNWKVLSSKTIVKDPWINLQADDCQMTNGTMIAPFYVNHIPDFVVIVAITHNQELLLERQYRHGIKRVLLEVPAGCVEPGEDVEEAARRELLEETGYEAGKLQFLCKIAPNASCLSNYAHCYLATEARKVSGQHLDATEEMELTMMPLGAVKRALKDGAFVQAVHMAALYQALEYLDD